MRKTKRRVLGQHFLANRSLLRKIVSIIDPGKDDLVIEIGAGKGALTMPLAEKAGKVVAVEKDRTLIPHLESLGMPNIEIIEADILAVDLPGLILRRKGLLRNAKFAGNLPYSISSPLLFRILEARDHFSEAFFLLQKEVAERIAAGPGTKKYAPLSIFFQNEFVVKVEISVSPGSFSPPPRVDSALISLKKRETPLFSPADGRDFSEFVKAAFAQRRKILWKNLRRLDILPARLDAAREKLGLDRAARAEELSIGQFAGLYRLLREETTPGPTNPPGRF
ncbi:MAG: 16S rRNA (adenine(1518)-N(6)/adenine(1519)-N(6))-dimethyltransferase RsmA [Acidobacteriota bacterium]|nr:16S rRNA (adenine(1518)-N(6)/adenine(1519)-N(6))-dimethyltransferase RsmA [Acidobacteriota bacterium]